MYNSIKHLEAITVLVKDTDVDNYLTTLSGRAVLLVGNYDDNNGAEVHLSSACPMELGKNAAGETVVLVTTYPNLELNGRTGFVSLFCAEDESYPHEFMTEEGTDKETICLQTDSYFSSKPNELRQQTLIGRVSSFPELKTLLLNFKG